MIDLDAIKARLAAACPGPWTGMTVRRPIDGNCLAIVREHAEGEHKSEKGSTLTVAATLLPQYGDNDTAVMLLHSRADIEALVAEVELLRGERASVVAWLRAEMQPCSGPVRGTLAYAANSIERGEHRREEEP